MNPASGGAVVESAFSGARLLRVVAAAAVVLLLEGCSTSTATSGPTGDDAKYTQTWPKGYSSTTCAEWTSQLTPAQQFAAAADMLTGARNSGDGGDGLPPDSLILAFSYEVNDACSLPAASSMSVAETGAATYLVGRAKYRP